MDITFILFLLAIIAISEFGLMMVKETKEMERKLYESDSDEIRQAIKDADDREDWG